MMRTPEQVQRSIESYSDEYSKSLKVYLLDRLDQLSKELIEITKEVQKWRN